MPAQVPPTTAKAELPNSGADDLAPASGFIVALAMTIPVWLFLAWLGGF